MVATWRDVIGWMGYKALVIALLHRVLLRGGFGLGVLTVKIFKRESWNCTLLYGVGND